MRSQAPPRTAGGSPPAPSPPAPHHGRSWASTTGPSEGTVGQAKTSRAPPLPCGHSVRNALEPHWASDWSTRPYCTPSGAPPRAPRGAARRTFKIHGFATACDHPTGARPRAPAPAAPRASHYARVTSEQQLAWRCRLPVKWRSPSLWKWARQDHQGDKPGQSAPRCPLWTPFLRGFLALWGARTSSSPESWFPIADRPASFPRLKSAGMPCGAPERGSRDPMLRS